MSLSFNRTGAVTLLGVLTLAELWLSSGKLGYQVSYAQPRPGNRIVPDRTLNDESSTLRQVNDRRTQIEGGAIRGRHLFHSFRDFNVQQFEEVYFANPSGIEAILGRITGDRHSDIFGTLGVDGAASLFLLNPNGFVFGENAVLDIRGSFVASTGDRFEFANGLEFSATNPDAAPLLTVDIPAGVQLGNSALGDIESLAQLSTGEDLTLMGHDVAISGALIAEGNLTVQATDTLQIRDSVNQPFIASAGDRLHLQGNTQLDIFALNHPNSYLQSGDTLTLRSSSPVIGDARYQSGGSFRVETLEGEPGDLRSPNDPVIRSAGDVIINTYEGTSLHILAGGQVTANEITVTGAAPGTAGSDFIVETVRLSNGESVAINGGDRPTADIRAGVLPSAIGGVGVSGANGIIQLDPANPGSATPTRADITIGQLSVTNANGSVLLSNQYQPNPALAPGNIRVGTLDTGTNPGGGDVPIFVGDGGDIVIDAGDRVVVDNQIDASSANGRAGDITVLAGGEVSLDGGVLVTNNLGVGRGGDITIRSGSLLVDNQGRIESSTFGIGDAGRIVIETEGDATFRENNSGIVNIIREGARGNSGGIFIESENIFLTEGAQFQVRVGDRQAGNVAIPPSVGNGGDVTLISRGILSLRRASSINTSIERQGTGEAGNTSLQAERVEIRGGSTLQSNTLGVGPAGDITITATDDFLLAGQDGNRRSEIFTRINGSGSGTAGDITVNVLNGTATIRNRGQLNSRALGEGTGGNITVTAQEDILIQDRARIRTDLSERGFGSAGDILIRSRNGSITVDGAGQNNEPVEILSETFGPGNGGNIRFIAAETITLQDDVDIVSTLEQQSVDGGLFQAGNISLEAERIELIDDVDIEARTNGVGNGSTIILDAETSVLLTEDVALRSQVEEDGVGNAGNIVITAQTGSIIAQDEVRINASVLGTGQGGSIRLNAGDQFLLENDADVRSFVRASGQGDAGSIVIDADTVTVRDNAELKTSTLGDGDAGDITIRADDTVVFDGALISDVPQNSLDVSITGALSSVEPSSTGTGGTIQIDANSVSITNGAQLDVSTRSNENAGDIAIQAANGIQITNDGIIFSQVREGATGNGGTITLAAPSLEITSGGRIETRTFGYIPQVLAQQLEGATYSSVVQANQPAAYWQLNEQSGEAIAIDSSGNAIDGTYGGEVVQGQPGVSGTAVDFSRNGSEVDAGEVANDSPLDLRNDSFTIEAWIQPNADPPNGQVYFSLHDRNRTNRSLNLAVDDDGDVRFRFFRNNLISDDEVVSFGTNEWFHVVTRYDSETEASTIFVNGEPVARGIEGPYQGRQPTVRIGAWRNITDDAFDGTIDEVAVYGEALSNQDIQEHYLAGQSSLGRAVDSLQQNGARAGDIQIDADSVVISGRSSNQSSGLFSGTEGMASGRGGDIRVTSNTLTLSDGSVVSAVTQNQSPGGRVTLNVAETVALEAGGQVITNATSSATGRAGQIAVRGSEQLVIEGALANPSIEQEIINNAAPSGLFASTDGSARGGNITVNVPGSVILRNDGVISASTSGTGRGGTIDTSARSLELRDDAQILASTSGTGRGGAIQVEVDEQLTIQTRGTISASTSDTGRGGRIALEGDRILLDDSGRVSASTSGEGNGGDVTIDANQLTIQGRSQVDANTTRRRNGGDGGTIRVTADELDLRRNGRISTSSSGSGNAGGIIIRDADQLRLRSGASIAATTRLAENGGVGGTIEIGADHIQITDSGTISTSTRGDGNGGRIFVEADTVDVFDGGQILTSTEGAGNAGDLEFLVSDRIDVAGPESGLLANTVAGSSGDGGNIVIDPELVVVRDGAVIGASSEGTGRGGSVDITADRLEVLNGGRILANNSGLEPGGNILLDTDILFLDNGATISASTASVNGGNIEIFADDLMVLRRGSSIRTDAGTGEEGIGNGGNITIDTNLLVAVSSENSDISANAVRGQGGSVNITAPLGIYGITLRDEPTPLSDITVSSTFGSSGVVILNTPDVDPSRGTSELPSDFVNPAFSQVCQADGSASSSRFVDTGRGGVPVSADAALSSLGGLWDDRRSLDDAVQSTSTFPRSHPDTEHGREDTASSTHNVVEAQGWAVQNGEIVLATQSSNVVPYSSLQMPLACGQPTATPTQEQSNHNDSAPSGHHDDVREGLE